MWYLQTKSQTYRTFIYLMSSCGLCSGWGNAFSLSCGIVNGLDAAWEDHMTEHLEMCAGSQAKHFHFFSFMVSSCLGLLAMYHWLCEFKCICPHQHILVIKEKKVTALSSDAEFLTTDIKCQNENKILCFHSGSSCFFNLKWRGEGWAICKQWMDQTFHERERLWRGAKGKSQH